jgi:hypothetical protein
MEPAFPGPPAGLIMMAPRGDYALAQVGNDIYSVMLPKIGGSAPTVSVANVMTTPVPTRKLTDIGGEFPSWSADGQRVHWAMGNALATYDLSSAQAVDDSDQGAAGPKPTVRPVRTHGLDSLRRRTRADSISQRRQRTAGLAEGRINALRADSVKVRADSLIMRVDSIQLRADSLLKRPQLIREGRRHRSRPTRRAATNRMKCASASPCRVTYLAAPSCCAAAAPSR